MAFVELLLGALVAGLGFVLAGVGAAAWRRTGMRQMLVTALAFAMAGAGGAAFVVLVTFEGSPSPTAPVALAGGVLAALATFYFALFGRRDA